MESNAIWHSFWHLHVSRNISSMFPVIVRQIYTLTRSLTWNLEHILTPFLRCVLIRVLFRRLFGYALKHAFWHYLWQFQCDKHFILFSCTFKDTNALAYILTCLPSNQTSNIHSEAWHMLPHALNMQASLKPGRVPELLQRWIVLGWSPVVTWGSSISRNHPLSEDGPSAEEDQTRATRLEVP